MVVQYRWWNYTSTHHTQTFLPSYLSTLENFSFLLNIFSLYLHPNKIQIMHNVSLHNILQLAIRKSQVKLVHLKFSKVRSFFFLLNRYKNFFFSSFLFLISYFDTSLVTSSLRWAQPEAISCGVMGVLLRLLHCVRNDGKQLDTIYNQKLKTKPINNL